MDAAGPCAEGLSAFPILDSETFILKHLLFLDVPPPYLWVSFSEYFLRNPQSFFIHPLCLRWLLGEEQVARIGVQTHAQKEPCVGLFVR